MSLVVHTVRLQSLKFPYMQRSIGAKQIFKETGPKPGAVCALLIHMFMLAGAQPAVAS